MATNRILEEIWRVKDQLAREAEYDVHRLCENTRKWAAEHPHSGPIIHNDEEFRQFLAQHETKRTPPPTLILEDEAPRPKPD